MNSHTFLLWVKDQRQAEKFLELERHYLAIYFSPINNRKRTLFLVVCWPEFLEDIVATLRKHTVVVAYPNVFGLASILVKIQPREIAKLLGVTLYYNATK